MKKIILITMLMSAVFAQRDCLAASWVESYQGDDMTDCEKSSYKLFNTISAEGKTFKKKQWIAWRSENKPQVSEGQGYFRTIDRNKNGKINKKEFFRFYKRLKETEQLRILATYQLQLTVHVMRDIEMNVQGVAMTTDHITSSVIQDEIMPEVNRIWKQGDIHWNLEEVIFEDVKKENYVGVSNQVWRTKNMAVEGSGGGVPISTLLFNETDATNTEEFLNIGDSMCKEVERCAGFVITFTDTNKTTPRQIVFKSNLSEMQERTKKDTYSFIPKTYNEMKSIVENAVRDSDSRSDPRRLVPLFLFMDPENRIQLDEFGTNNFHIYIYPFTGNTGQGNAMRVSFGWSFGFHTIIGAWSNKHNYGGPPEEALITEEWNEWDGIDRGSLSRTIAHELGHVLGVNHDDCEGNCLMGPTHGYLLTEAQIATVKDHVEMRINGQCQPLSECGYKGNFDAFFGN